AGAGALAPLSNHAHDVRRIVASRDRHATVIRGGYWAHLHSHSAEEGLVVLDLRELRAGKTVHHLARIDEIAPGALDRCVKLGGLLDAQRHPPPPGETRPNAQNHRGRTRRTPANTEKRACCERARKGSN